uniref:Uncharacterized protein n=1 Tax=uncultured Gemmatimonadetes bacterium Rifle_16ft_4_minimus_7 TaxID=1665098 RepID=A0A0H4TDM0_9BACT|nr:hypothetical protein [uncultured Gemmatimonadetes bacterium Rifle_16ft_4_minimus_7]
MGPKTKAAVIALGVGALLGIVLAQYSMGRHREDLFSRRALRRLSALGYLSGHPSVEAVRLLRDYLAWEEHPMLRRRAEAIVRRMEAKLA